MDRPSAQLALRRFLRHTLATLTVMAIPFCIWIGWNAKAALHERERLLQDRRFYVWFESPSLKAAEGKGASALPISWRLCGARAVVAIQMPQSIFSEDDERRYRAMFPEADVYRVPKLDNPPLPSPDLPAPG